MKCIIFIVSKLRTTKLIWSLKVKHSLAGTIIVGAIMIVMCCFPKQWQIKMQDCSHAMCGLFWQLPTHYFLHFLVIQFSFTFTHLTEALKHGFQYIQGMHIKMHVSMESNPWFWTTIMQYKNQATQILNLLSKRKGTLCLTCYRGIHLVNSSTSHISIKHQMTSWESCTCPVW